MTVGQIATTLQEAGWQVLRQRGTVCTFIEPGSEQLLTLAGELSAHVPEVVLSDIRWTASIV
jgi:predicted RNA binding protein YcfA (HicA-like mRNA interferase family)